MRIIDAHVHLWHQDGAKYPNRPWVQGNLPAHDATGERLIGLMDDAGVDAALNVQVPWYGEDNSYHRDVISQFPKRLSLLAVIEPAGEQAVEVLDRLVRTDAAQGFRIHFNEPGRAEQVAGGGCDPAIALAGELGVTVQCLARMGDMPVIAGSARKFPRTNFVIDHLAHPDLSEPPPFPSASEFFALADLPNVYLKVSLLCDHSRMDYPYSDVQSYVQLAIERFGANRLMWGSNFPLIPEVRTEQPVDYKRSLELVLNDWSWLSEEQTEWIVGKTALSLWRFDER